MIEGGGGEGASDGAAVGLTVNDVVGFSAALRGLGAHFGAAPADEMSPGDNDAGGSAELIDQIRCLEALKAAAAAAQARATTRFAAAQRSAQRSAGVRAGDVGKGIAAQVALARRDSPVKGSRHLGLAEALCREMPNTLAALEVGVVSEWRATLVVRETACLSVEHRGQVDAELAALPGAVAEMSDRATVREARRIAYRLDPHAVTNRAAKAVGDRRVTLRPAPDTMGLLTGLLPVQQAVAAYASLTKHADAQRAAGDERGRGQIMSDTYFERLTGLSAAEPVPVEVGLVMTDQTLLGGGTEPAEMAGYGPIPAPLARQWLRGDPTTGGHKDGSKDEHKDRDDRLEDQAQVWLRRLYTTPAGRLGAMESTQRRFEDNLRRFVIFQDRTCRTPWCDAPIRHVDHPVPVAQGGRTTAANSQGLCEACNYTKEAAGWRARVAADGAVETTMPTGHRYVSRPPPAVGQRSAPTPPRPRVGQSRLECFFRDVILAA